MSNKVLLNFQDHKALKVITTHSEKYGDNLMYAMTFPVEFRNIQSHYPIFFQKDSSRGQFFPLALLGLQEQENLFLKDEGWDASYIPLMMKHQPFLIGFQQTGTDNKVQKQPVVSIDLDNSRVNTLKGEALFLDNGGHSDYLINVCKMLEAIHRGHQHGKLFIDALLKFELLESFSLSIDLCDGSHNQLLGLYTLNEEKLQALDGNALGELNAGGFLQPLFMIVASHSRIKHLIERKNAIVATANTM